MKTIVFLKNHCGYKQGDTVKFIVDNHAESLIASGVATDKIEKPKKSTKK